MLKKASSVTTENCVPMRAFSSAALVLVATLVSAPSCALQPPVSPAGDKMVISESRAKAIATEEFERFTRGRVTKVSVSKLTETAESWMFRFAGREDYERPGFHWHVKVNKSTGTAEVIPGE